MSPDNPARTGAHFFCLLKLAKRRGKDLLALPSFGCCERMKLSQICRGVDH